MVEIGNLLRVWRLLDLPLGPGAGDTSCSGVVREGRGTYAVQGGDSELTDKFDDVDASTVGLAGLCQRLEADEAGASRSTFAG